MKRFVAVLSSLLVLPAFAEVAPIFYEDAIEYSEEVYDDADMGANGESVADDNAKSVAAPVTPSRISPRTNTGRVTSSRAVASTNGANTSARGTKSRSVATRTTTTNAARTAATSRGTTARATRTATNSNNTQSVSTRRTTQSAPAANTARASIMQADTVNAPLYTGRVGVRTSSSVSARVPTIRVAATNITEEATVATTTSMDELAQITDFCKAQYTQCMDNFCNVLDDNQGRCSCSANLKNYEKTEQALKSATSELQEVAQKIQYIGLTGDQVESLFTQTEAELEMQSKTDNTRLKNDLDKIKGMIVDVKTGTATSTASGMSMDLSGLLDFSIDSSGFDLSSLMGGTSSTSSISNQRGEQLYKTASARCKASVLNSCQSQGVNVSVITNAYDLEIDKQCMAYERSLSDANEQMAQTVTNAKSVLQKARLMVAQQKNSYDLRGCVNALDSCMQDDFVCGTDYENCLDPTGKFIVNGKVVAGSQPGVSGEITEKGGLYSVWQGNGTNPWTVDGTNTLSDYIDATVKSNPEKPSTDISQYLQYKIGYNSGDKNYGMCMSVLNSCQDITYNGTGSNKRYLPNNNVIKEFLQRTLIQIKAKQDTILADYAEDCISDVTSCLSQNNYNSTNQSTINLAINACKSLITTCMSVNGVAANATADMLAWVQASQASEICPSDAVGTYPNCKCNVAGKSYVPSLNACMPDCPTGTTGIAQPYCTCTDASKLFDTVSKTCK